SPNAPFQAFRAHAIELFFAHNEPDTVDVFGEELPCRFVPNRAGVDWDMLILSPPRHGRLDGQRSLSGNGACGGRWGRGRDIGNLPSAEADESVPMVYDG